MSFRLFNYGAVTPDCPRKRSVHWNRPDYAIAYSAAPGSVTGGSIGITHPAPFFPNIGYSTVSFNDKEDRTDSENSSSVSLTTKTTIKTINLFYNVPFPVVSIAVGFGFGSDNLYTGVETKTTEIVETTSEGTKTTPQTSDFKTDVTEAFIRIGLPFWSTIEFHLGYHAMSFTSIDITKSATLLGTYSIDKKSYSGGMTTIGVQVAF